MKKNKNKRPYSLSLLAVAQHQLFVADISRYELDGFNSIAPR